MATTNKAFRVKTGLIVEGAELKPAVGTTAYPPILLTSGTNLTSATAGAFEYDGTRFYLSPSTTRKAIALTDSTGATLDSTITGSSLTSVGTLANLTVTNTITGSISGNAATATNGVVTTGTYSNPSWITGLAWSKISTTPTTLSGYGIIDAASSTHTHGNITNGGAIGSTANLVAVTTTSGQLTVAATPSSTSTQFLRGDLTWVVPTDTNYYATAVTMTAGTTAGPLVGLTMNTGTVTSAAIPSAAVGSSGIVTTGAQEFAGVKTLTSPSITTNLTTTSSSFDLVNTTATTVNFAGAATAVNIGATAGTVTIAGNLTVNGITTTLNSNTLAIDDKNLELGSVSTGVVSTTGTIGTVAGTGPFTATITGMSSTTGLIPGQVITATAGTGNFGSGVVSVVTIASSTSITISSTLTFTAGTVTNITGAAASDASADSGGITLKGTTDKTFQWANTGANWTSSENLSLATGKTFKINNADVISGTAAALVIGEGASTTINIGNAAGIASILNPTVTLTNATTLNIGGATASIVGTTVAGAASVFNTNTGTVNFGGAALNVNLGGATNPGTTNLSVGASTTGTHTTNIATGDVTGASKNVNIGTGNIISSTMAINIGVGTITTAGSIITTIGNTVKLPQVGTSGFVKLGASGVLSADTNTYIGASSPALTGTPTINSIGAVATSTFTTSGTTPGTSSTIFSTATYNGAEIVIKAVNSTTIEIIKALVVIDSTGNVYNTQYADIQTGTQLIGTLDYTTTSGNFVISITPFAGTTGTTTYKAVLTLIAA